MWQDLQKARALGNALLFFLVVPWTLTLIFYTGTARHRINSRLSLKPISSSCLAATRNHLSSVEPACMH